MKKNNVYILEDRGLLYVSGDDVKEFLQNIITNDIDAVSENNSCFAGLLSPQGKYLYDFIVVKHKSGYFLDCEKKIIDELYKQLTLYKLRSKVDILNLSNEFVVAALHKNKFLELENSKDQNGYTTKYREDTISRIKHKNKLSKRILPFTLLEGNIDNEILKVNNTEIGKVLINNSKPFALIKIKEKEFEFDKELNCENAKVLFKKPQWLSII